MGCARNVAGGELLVLAHVDQDRAVADLAAHLGRVDLVDLAANVLLDLGA